MNKNLILKLDGFMNKIYKKLNSLKDEQVKAKVIIVAQEVVARKKATIDQDMQKIYDEIYEEIRFQNDYHYSRELNKYVKKVRRLEKKKELTIEDKRMLDWYLAEISELSEEMEDLNVKIREYNSIKALNVKELKKFEDYISSMKKTFVTDEVSYRRQEEALKKRKTTVLARNVAGYLREKGKGNFILESMNAVKNSMTEWFAEKSLRVKAFILAGVSGVSGFFGFLTFGAIAIDKVAEPLPEKPIVEYDETAISKNGEIHIDDKIVILPEEEGFQDMDPEHDEKDNPDNFRDSLEVKLPEQPNDEEIEEEKIDDIDSNVEEELPQLDEKTLQYIESLPPEEKERIEYIANLSSEEQYFEFVKSMESHIDVLEYRDGGVAGGYGRYRTYRQAEAQKLYVGQSVSKELAEEWLREDIKLHADLVYDMLKNYPELELNADQINVLTDIAFQTGRRRKG